MGHSTDCEGCGRSTSHLRRIESGQSLCLDCWNELHGMVETDSYLVFDFETTGLDPRRDRIVQVGICRVRDDVVVEGDSWIVKQPVRIPREVSRIHGITTDRMMAEGIPPKDALDRLLGYMTQAKECVGHNIHRFDNQFLAAEARRCGLTCPDCRNYVDTAALYKGWKLGIRRSPRMTHQQYAEDVLSRKVEGLRYSVAVCIEHLGITLDTDNLHDAGRDCYATHLIYQKLKKLIR